MEDSVTVLLNILQLKISPVLLAEAYVNLGEILLHSAEELINYEACCAHLEKESVSFVDFIEFGKVN